VRKEYDEAIELKVRAVPLEVDGRNLVLLLLREIRDEKRRHALERTFFHDLNNTLMGITGHAELLAATDPDNSKTLAQKLEHLAHVAAEEMSSYQLLAKADAGECVVTPRVLKVGRLLEDLRRTFAGYPAAAGRNLQVEPPPLDLTVESDSSLVHRVLVNMGKNALEATAEGGTVRVWCNDGVDTVTFRVWNAGAMSETVAMRVFQRYFSTKPGPGRGLGTYGMKLLGERYLRGAVGFSSDAVRGTIFHLALPRRWGSHGQT
jgi:signal transduction histidine kinase